MSRLRIAAVQFELRPEPRFEGFAEHVESVVHRAAQQGAELVVLPELVTTGLLASHPQAGKLRRADMGEAYRETLAALTDRYVDLVRSLAITHRLALVGGSHYRARHDGACRNTAYLADPSGAILMQDKLHLTPPEVAMGTKPGDGVVTHRVGAATVAIQICADIEFPEVSRILALAGADVIVCPSLTWNRRGATRVRVSSIARSIENQIFVATSPLIGTCGIPHDGAMHGTGRAMISCPVDRLFGRNDGVLAEAEAASEAVVVADLDFEMLRASRADPEPPGFRNIRPELYKSLSTAAA